MRSQKSSHGTFLHDSTPKDRHKQDEGGDPHDLSYSSSHAPRASMVESMAFALDAFSNDFSEPPYTARSNSYESPSRPRGRGHTFSSSASSDTDLREIKPNVMHSQNIPPRLARRDSSKYHKDLQKLPSIFGEDEDSVRAKVYDAQRAQLPPPRSRPRKSTRTAGKNNPGSASSSIDLGHLAAFQGRLGPAGNRRSRSFDFGSHQRPLHDFNRPDPIDVAPTPVIFAGPEAQSSPTKATFSTTPLARRGSTRSSRSQHIRKSRAGTLGTAAIKNKPGDIPPPVPLPKQPLYGPPLPEGRPSTTSPHEATFASRPGFFRRVFGSSRSVTAQLDHPPLPGVSSTRPSQDHPRLEANSPNPPPAKLHKPARLSSDFAANKENHPVVTKKPSSFFRRRKKSVSGGAPPPLPLTLNSDRFNGHPGEPSPVSSLRAFMDPYLGSDVLPSPIRPGHARKDSNQSFHGPYLAQAPTSMPRQQSPQPRLDDIGRAESPASIRELPQAKPKASLRIPHHDSFLADSSSTEEPSRRTPREASPISDFDKDEFRSRHVDSNLRPSSSVPLLTDRPQIPERQESWVTEKSNRDFSRSPEPQSAGTAHTASSHIEGLEGSKASSSLDVGSKPRPLKLSPKASASDVSVYRSAPSTPLITEAPVKASKGSPYVHVSHPSIVEDVDLNMQKAQKIYDNADEELDKSAAAAWLGDAGTERERVRDAFMKLFDFTHLNILASLRSLCARIILKGETQQMDRLIDAFAKRWCECNSTHGFKSNDVVHTICYSILLLNTDLHLADIGSKMTKNQFVRNAMNTVKRVAEDEAVSRASTNGMRSPTFPKDETAIDEIGEHDPSSTVRLNKRPTDRFNREESGDIEPNTGNGGPLIEAPHVGSERGWESQIELVLRSFYSSIAQEPLVLFGSQDTYVPPSQSNNLLSLGTNMLRRTPSTLSKAQSETNRGRPGSDNKSLGSRWIGKARSRPRLPSAAGFGSSKTSLDEGSSAWSPSISSTWSKNSLGKTLTSMSVDSFGTEATHPDYQSSIGFANALSQAIIRDDQFDVISDEGIKATPLLEDESLELCGAPWAKEGILKHKCHLEGVDKRSKDRNWNDCFAVIEKGYMRLFSFSMTAKSLRNKARNQRAGGVVGGGNWQDNAEEVWKFVLRHAIASALPPPGYSKTRPYVWALSLPTGAVHLFSVGTPDIVKEFVTTANFWSARLSKEPMMGGISNMEYGWSDTVVNRALIGNDSSSRVNMASPRPSTQLSMRSSLDHGGGARPRLPGDRVYINEWQPPQQSMFASQLLEVDQLKALQTYVNNVEEELQKHNELRGPMLLAFSTKHPNSAKAMNNWEKKSSYLLREIVKFRTYIDTLQTAQGTKERIYKMRKEEEEARRAEDDAAALRGIAEA